jgi:hypothetical protein
VFSAEFCGCEKSAKITIVKIYQHTSLDKNNTMAKTEKAE